ncbi:MAG TPA: UrcA family protein [Phenylobacterium sp.]|nr:UrcA family protein [Phenylobacterium sp.]
MIRPAPTSLVAAALCLAAIVQPAAAQSYPLRPGYSFDSSKIVTYTRVPYSDIDVTSPAGIQALLQRIENAADAVCGGAANKVSKPEKEDYRECREFAVSGAVAKMRSPALTMLASRRQAELRAAR